MKITENLFLVTGSHGSISASRVDGRATDYDVNNHDQDGGGHYEQIERFEIDEYMAYFGLDEMPDSIDIVDISYWYDRDGESVLEKFEPRHRSRTKFMHSGHKMVMVREYLYGKDVTEFGDDGKVILYDTPEDAADELEDYNACITDAYHNGDVDEPYNDDCSMIEVEVIGNKLKCVNTGEEFYIDQQISEEVQESPKAENIFNVASLEEGTINIDINDFHKLVAILQAHNDDCRTGFDDGTYDDPLPEHLNDLETRMLKKC